MAKILCPYCFTHFDSSQVLVQCGNNNIGPDGNYQCPHDSNSEYEKFWGPGNLVGHTFKPQKAGFLGLGGLAKVQKCDECAKENIDRYVCPHCNNRIPTEMVENGSEIISVIGFPNSGKTNYIIALIHELMYLGNNLGIDVTPSQMHADGDKFIKFSTDSRYNEMERSLFKDKAFLAKTPEKQMQVPLIFKLYQKSTDKTIYLVFYDTAGEHFTQGDKMLNSDTIKYLKESSGLIILADPFSIEAVTENLASRFAKDIDYQTQLGQAQGQGMSLMSLKNTLEESLRHLEAIYKKPVAFVFSKFDIIINNKDLFDFSVDAFKQGTQLINSSFINDNVVDVTNINSTSQTIEGFLNCWKQGFFTSWVQNWAGNRKNPDPNDPKNMYKYFGVSATGEMSHNGQLTQVKPFRVMDPLVWVLLKLGKFKFRTK